MENENSSLSWCPVHEEKLGYHAIVWVSTTRSPAIAIDNTFPTVVISSPWLDWISMYQDPVVVTGQVIYGGRE